MSVDLGRITLLLAASPPPVCAVEATPEAQLAVEVSTSIAPRISVEVHPRPDLGWRGEVGATACRLAAELVAVRVRAPARPLARSARRRGASPRPDPGEGR